MRRAFSRRAWSRRAVAVPPETIHGMTGSVTVRGGPSVVPSAGGGSSMITWAFVPPKPNEETAARRGAPVSGQGLASLSRETAPASHSTWVVG
ncbi:hypothetical protein EES45_35080 [Streptomyces sp. ADI97-07]|nr:hypothetical protein EES45_35080 [Streptomyces sp. ADI97-07]